MSVETITLGAKRSRLADDGAVLHIADLVLTQDELVTAQLKCALVENDPAFEYRDLLEIIGLEAIGFNVNRLTTIGLFGARRAGYR